MQLWSCSSAPVWGCASWCDNSSSGLSSVPGRAWLCLLLALRYVAKNMPLEEDAWCNGDRGGDDGQDSFSQDSPNPTVSGLAGEKGGIADAVVVLMNLKLDGTILEVEVLEGDLMGMKGSAAVFIDSHVFGSDGGDGWHGD